MEYCSCCGKNVSTPQEKKQRRLLSSCTLQTVLQTLNNFIGKLQANVEDVRDGFICRPCVRLMERYNKVHEEVLCSVMKAHPVLRVARPTKDITAHTGESSAVAGPAQLSQPGSSPSLPACHSSQQTTNIESPALMATIHYKSQPKSFLVTPTRRRICRPLIRKNYRSFSSQCARNSLTRKALVKTISRIVNKEVAVMCSDKCTSILRCKSEKLVDFDISHVIKELHSQAPTLLSLLKGCLTTKTPRQNEDVMLGVIAGLICKHRRSSCSLVQRMISLVLYAGHSAKQVYQRLQKAGLCMSHASTINLVESLGEDFDMAVKEWKQAAEKKMTMEQAHDREQTTIIPFIGMEESSSPPETPPPSPPPPSPPLLSSFRKSDDTASLSSMESIEQYIDDLNMSKEYPFDDSNSDPDTFLPQTGDESAPLQSDVINATNSDTSATLQTEDGASLNSGFKIVFDNIDKNVRPRFMRKEHQTQSLHYVQAYAVKDRINFSELSDENPTEANAYDIIPDESDYQSLKSNFTVLVSRIIVEYMPFFSTDYKGIPQSHIPHKYTKQMSSKSEVVPLGVLLKSETNYEDMTEILEHYQTYVPSLTCKKSIPETGLTEDKCFLPTLVGGDYLSVARARGAQLIRSTSELVKHTLGGILPVAEDWHAKVCFMEVMWKRLYHTDSGIERGTLYQLRNLINRRNVTKEAKSDVNANEDFLEVSVMGYILVTAMSVLGMTDLHGAPLASLISPDLWMEDDSVRSSMLKKIASKVVEHVDLATEFCNPDPSSSSSAPADHGPLSSTVYGYTREVISLGLLYLNFKDAVREGDGERVLRTWKYFLLIFRATGHTNYAMEAFTLLTQCFVVLPPNLAEQVKWCRFVNVHGQPGKNISCDLHMEHLNRVVKTAIEGLGANKTMKAIVRVGKCVGTFEKILDAYDKQAGVAALSGKHSKPSLLKDLHEVVQQLLEADIFDTSRAHKSFSNLKPNLIRKLSQKDLKDWIIDKLSMYASCY